MERIKLTVRLTEEVHSALTAEAERRGVSLNALISTVLDQWAGSAERFRTAIKQAKESGDGS